MKPIALHGHERAITHIKYNREGDLLFSAAKDTSPNVWFSTNGERLGTFQGHNGAVWCIDVTYDTTKLLSGASDSNWIVWDCETGSILHKMTAKTAVRTCSFSYSSNLIAVTTDATMGHNCEIFMFDIRDSYQMKNNSPAVVEAISAPLSKITSMVWSHLDDRIVTGHDKGELCKWDMTATNPQGPELSTAPHSAAITDIQLNTEQTLLITASKDESAKLFTASQLEHHKTYKTDRPVNGAAMSPIKPHIVIGGGREAMEAALTAAKAGKLDAQFFHMIFEEEFARVKGHFGPINSLAFHPDGKSFSTGGEDGLVRMNTFDEDYFLVEFDH